MNERVCVRQRARVHEKLQMGTIIMTERVCV